MISVTRPFAVAATLLLASVSCSPPVETGQREAPPTLVPLEEMTPTPPPDSREPERDPEAWAAQDSYLECLQNAGYDLTSAAMIRVYFQYPTFPFRGDPVLPDDYDFNVAHLTCEIEAGLREEARDPKVLAAQGSSRMDRHARCMREAGWDEFPDPTLLVNPATGREQQPLGQIVGDVVWPGDPDFHGDPDRFWEDYRHCAEEINIPIALYRDP